MRRIERKVFALNEEVARLRREAELTEGELNMHRHLADDAARDAALDEGIERAESRMADRDVATLVKALERTRRDLERAEARRLELLRRMDDSR